MNQPVTCSCTKLCQKCTIFLIQHAICIPNFNKIVDINIPKKDDHYMTWINGEYISSVNLVRETYNLRILPDSYNKQLILEKEVKITYDTLYTYLNEVSYIY